MFKTYVRRLLLVIVAIVIVLIGICVGAFYLFTRIARNYGVSTTVLQEVIHHDFSRLKNTNGRTNIALLGIGGDGHESGDLTDTIMIASFDSTKKDVLLISLPRDIWVPSMKDKLNSAYHYGEQKEAGTGLELVKTAISEVTTVPIHYAMLLDFSGFVQMIDAVEGIDVDVLESFTDEAYPIAGRENDLCNGDLEFKCRYETVSFTKGIEHMDGNRALTYVRSRHAVGDEGTDFSRGKRQQAVLLSLKGKLLSVATLTDQQMLKKFISAANETILSTLVPDEFVLLGSSAIQGITVRSIALTQQLSDSDQKGLLINPPTWKYGGRWVLVPKHEDNFVRIGEYLVCEMYQKGECGKLIE